MPDGSWDPDPSSLQTCELVDCQPPLPEAPIGMGWDIAYRIFIDNQTNSGASPAETALTITCPQGLYFIEPHAHFEAVCLNTR